MRIVNLSEQTEERRGIIMNLLHKLAQEVWLWQGSIGPEHVGCKDPNCLNNVDDLELM